MLQWAEVGIVTYGAEARGAAEAAMAGLEAENVDWGLREMYLENDTVSVCSELNPAVHYI